MNHFAPLEVAELSDLPPIRTSYRRRTHRGLGKISTAFTNGRGRSAMHRLDFTWDNTYKPIVRQFGQEMRMAGGWAKDGAVQDQIDASVADAVKQARAQLAGGEALRECEDCGITIPEARRRAVPGVRRCVECQEAVDSREQRAALFNRRGSKDSQLR